MSGSSVFAIVLAAGTASRFGSIKQLREFRGATLVRRATELAEGVCGERSVLVVGHEWQKVVEASAPLRGFFVRNEQYRDGIASSISQGVRAVAQAADAVLLILADQPLVTVSHLRALAEQWAQSKSDIVASQYAGVTGPPIVFPARCFPKLMALQGDHGARSVVAGDTGSVRAITFEDGAIDIDRSADLEAIA
jgi:molybdenum cofactor cytidylyltransferase